MVRESIWVVLQDARSTSNYDSTPKKISIILILKILSLLSNIFVIYPIIKKDFLSTMPIILRTKESEPLENCSTLTYCLRCVSFKNLQEVNYQSSDLNKRLFFMMSRAMKMMLISTMITKKK